MPCFPVLSLESWLESDSGKTALGCLPLWWWLGLFVWCYNAWSTYVWGGGDPLLDSLSLPESSVTRRARFSGTDHPRTSRPPCCQPQRPLQVQITTTKGKCGSSFSPCPSKPQSASLSPAHPHSSFFSIRALWQPDAPSWGLLFIQHHAAPSRTFKNPYSTIILNLQMYSQVFLQIQSALPPGPLLRFIHS